MTIDEFLAELATVDLGNQRRNDGEIIRHMPRAQGDALERAGSPAPFQCPITLLAQDRETDGRRWTAGGWQDAARVLGISTEDATRIVEAADGVSREAPLRRRIEVALAKALRKAA